MSATNETLHDHDPRERNETPGAQAGVIPSETQAGQATSNPREAPGDLALVRAFINTMDFDERVETFSSPEALRDWLVAHSLARPDDAVSQGDVERAVSLREALRALILANNDGTPPAPQAVATVNEISEQFNLVTRFDAAGEAALEPACSGADGGLARLLAIVYQAGVDGTWSRLKACRNDTCLWAFYDASKNRSRHWCSMESCGSQVKARAYRARKKATSA
ncbi:MAG TPA: CGNR zinc finger domain-containing protein [Thermoleophilia bacterium]|nr:CGNR zinc finger domain-containing protein [Thermoleophilia bacterium]